MSTIERVSCVELLVTGYAPRPAPGVEVQLSVGIPDGIAVSTPCGGAFGGAKASSAVVQGR